MIGILGTSDFSDYNQFVYILNKIIQDAQLKGIKLTTPLPKEQYFGVSNLAIKYSESNSFPIQIYEEKKLIDGITKVLENSSIIILIHKNEIFVDYITNYARKKNIPIFSFDLKLI
jgi:hypothetical protein